MRYILTILIFIFSFSFGKSQESVVIDKYKSALPQYDLITNSNSQISFIIDINAYQLIQQQTSKNTSVVVRSEQAVPLYEKGNPDLPKVVKSVIIPNAGSMHVSFKPISYIDINDIEISPSKGIIKRNSSDSIPFLWNKSYETNAFYPGNLGAINDPYIFREHRGQSIEIYPFQYNPVSKVLRIYTSIEVILNHDENIAINEKNNEWEKSNIKLFDDAYKSHFLNYTNSQKYAIVPEEGAMLIVAHDDFYEQSIDFLKWKRQRGINARLFKYSEIASSSSELLNFVKEYYQTNKIVYLVLVGDAEHIPPLYKSGDSDAAYGHLEGEDSYAEVLVGRFSAQSALDLDVQLKKTIFYEQDMNASNEWLNQATCIASSEGGVGIGDNDETDREHMNKISQDLLDFGYSHVDQIYDLGATSVEVINSLDEGRSLVNYVGHGSNTEMVTSNFGPTSIGKLQNFEKYPYVFDVACINGNFKPLTCFAEFLMRAHKDSVPTGAVAIIASTINQEWAPPMNAQDEMIDILTESKSDNIKRTFGGITINGCMFMNDNYGAVGSQMTDTWTIFGDPSLLVRTKNPEIISAEYPKYMVHGMDMMEVLSTSENTTVTLVANNNLIAKGQIMNGKVELDIPYLPQIDQAILTLSGFNKVSLIDTIKFVLPEGPYVVLNAYELSDNKGNNNDIVEYGETIELSFDLKNIGLENAENVSLSLLTNNKYLSLGNDCTGQVVNVVDTGSVVKSGIFTIEIHDSIPDQERIEFILVIGLENNEEIVSDFALVASAPEIQILNYTFLELQGNFNQRIDAGEEIELRFPVTNTGHVDASELAFSLLAPNPYISLAWERNEPVGLNVNDTTEFICKLTANQSTPKGYEVDLLLELSEGRSYVDTQLLVIGQEPEIIIGEGVEAIAKYPFNNFYQSNKTQLIYTVEEIGNGEKLMQGITLFNSRVPELADKRWLSGLRIKIKHSDAIEHADEYSSMSGAEIVFQNDFQLPAYPGEVYIPFDTVFAYNGNDNLILELSWGQNDYYENVNSFTTLASKTQTNTVAYGYQDNTSYPRFVGVSDYRPNVVFQFVEEQVQIVSTTFNIFNSNTNSVYSDATIFIGGAQYLTNNEGNSNIDLALGEYEVRVEAGGRYLNTTVNIIQNNQVIDLDFTLLSVSDFESKVHIYPNPVRNELKIELPESNVKVTILDINGKVVYTTLCSEQSLSINTGDFSPGIYVVSIVSNKFYISRKLVVVN